MFIKEVAASLYPWDLADQTPETCIGNLTEHAGVNSVYLVGIMHKEKRPLTSMFYTLDPKRKYYTPEDSRVYYRMDEANFRNTRLKPLYSARDFLKDVDWLDRLTACARKSGLKTGVEISHTVFDCEVADSQFPDTLQRTLRGGTMHGQFCCNNPDVREYLKAIFHDTVKNHDVDFIQTCMILFNSGTPVQPPWSVDVRGENRLGSLLGTLKGGCFCPHCKATAEKMGFDWGRIVEDLARIENMVDSGIYGNSSEVMQQHLTVAGDLLETGFLLENPSLFAWLEFRARCVTGLFKDIHAAVKKARATAELRYNNYLGYPELAGLDFIMTRDFLDSVRDSDYSEQSGVPDDFTGKRRKMMKIRRGIGFDRDLIAAIAIRPKATPPVIEQSIQALATVGIDGLSLGHYDGSTFELLDAVKSGMKKAGMAIG